MESIIINPIVNAIINLSEARANFAKSAKKTGEVLGTYALGMGQSFDLVDNTGAVTTKWYERKGKLKAGVNDERKLFIADFTAQGFDEATINVYWQRVKVASGYQTSGMKNRVVGGPLDVDKLTLSELKTIINRIFGAEEVSAKTGDESLHYKSSEVKGMLMNVYESLGGEVDKLG